jgi:hypothetical protein
MAALRASPVAFLGWLTRMLLGPVGLFAAAAAIVTDWGGWLTAADFAFFAVLGLMLLGRWAEFRAG